MSRRGGGRQTGVAKYDLSTDYLSDSIPLYEAFLGHLKDEPCHLLEIGSFEGGSTTWLLDNIATHESSRVDTIDAWESPKLLPNLIASGHHTKVRFHLGRSVDVLRTLPVNAYDFAYIDGSHWTMNVLEDLVHSFRLLKDGGIIGADDYLWDDPEYNQEGRPKEAVDAFLSIYASKIELLHQEYQVWIRKLSD